MTNEAALNECPVWRDGGVWKGWSGVTLPSSRVPDLVSGGRRAEAEVPFSVPAPVIILPSCPYVAATLTHGSFSHQPEADPRLHLIPPETLHSSGPDLQNLMLLPVLNLFFLDQLPPDKLLDTKN